MSTMLIWESPQCSANRLDQRRGSELPRDAIVSLKFVEIDSTIRRAIVVLKMRGAITTSRSASTRSPRTGQGARLVQGLSGIMSGSPTKVAAARFADAFREAAGKKGNELRRLG